MGVELYTALHNMYYSGNCDRYKNSLLIVENLGNDRVNLYMIEGTSYDKPDLISDNIEGNSVEELINSFKRTSSLPLFSECLVLHSTVPELLKGVSKQASRFSDEPVQVNSLFNLCEFFEEDGYRFRSLVRGDWRVF